MKAIHWYFTVAGPGERIMRFDVNRGQRTWYRLNGAEVLEQSPNELR